jgi:hypothetical protein
LNYHIISERKSSFNTEIHLIVQLNRLKTNSWFDRQLFGESEMRIRGKIKIKDAKDQYIYTYD